MTVRELKEKLSGVPDDMEVYVNSDEGVTEPTLAASVVPIMVSYEAKEQTEDGFMKPTVKRDFKTVFLIG